MHSLPFPFSSTLTSAISAGFPLAASGSDHSDPMRCDPCALMSLFTNFPLIIWMFRKLKHFTNCLKICCFFLSLYFPNRNNSCAHLAPHLSALWPRRGGWRVAFHLLFGQLEDAAAAIANIRPEVVTQNWKLCGRRFSRKKHAPNFNSNLPIPRWRRFPSLPHDLTFQALDSWPC